MYNLILLSHPMIYSVPGCLVEAHLLRKKSSSTTSVVASIRLSNSATPRLAASPYDSSLSVSSYIRCWALQDRPLLPRVKLICRDIVIHIGSKRVIWWSHSTALTLSSSAQPTSYITFLRHTHPYRTNAGALKLVNYPGTTYWLVRTG